MNVLQAGLCRRNLDSLKIGAANSKSSRQRAFGAAALAKMTRFRKENYVVGPLTKVEDRAQSMLGRILKPRICDV